MVFNGVTKNLAYLSSEYENLIRILGNDIPGERKTLIGLTQIRGLGYMFANSILQILKSTFSEFNNSMATFHTSPTQDPCLLGTCSSK